MGLLDGIEKLINEHGSAVILKERIALANDQYSVLEQRLSASEFREKQLKSENSSIHLDLEKAQIQIKNLENQLTHNNALVLKYGVYWDKDRNPYCPKCKTPTTHTAWQLT